MLTKLFIFGLLINTACPLPYSERNQETTTSKPVNQKTACADQIAWIINITLEVETQYEVFYAQLINNTSVTNDDVETQYDQIEKLIIDLLEKYIADLDKVHAMDVDDKDQLNIFCAEELKIFSGTIQNLSALTQRIRRRVTDFANEVEVDSMPPDVLDDLEYTLSKIINIYFIIEAGKNRFRDIHSILEEASVKTESRIKLEDKYRFTEEGVKPIGKLKEREIIGHIEEPAVGTDIKLLDGSQLAYNAVKLQPSAVDVLDHIPSRIGMLTTDIGNHTVEQAVIKKGLETIDHTEVPATAAAEKKENTPEEVPNVATEPSYDDYEDIEKELGEAVDEHDQNIERSNKELYEREEEEARLAKEREQQERLARQERQQEEDRLQKIEEESIFHHINVVRR